MSKKNPDVKFEKRNLKYFFKDNEVRDLGKKLAELHETYCTLEADKKRTVKDFDAKLSAVESESGIVTNSIRSGYEYRDIPVTVMMDAPKPGQKTITRDDTGETVAIEEMTWEEKQRELPMDDKANG